MENSLALCTFFLAGHRIPCITYSLIQFLYPVTFKCLREAYTTTPYLSARWALPVITLLCDHLGSPFRDAPLGEAVQDPPRIPNSSHLHPLLQTAVRDKNLVPGSSGPQSSAVPCAAVKPQKTKGEKRSRGTKKAGVFPNRSLKVRGGVIFQLSSHIRPHLIS